MRNQLTLEAVKVAEAARQKRIAKAYPSPSFSKAKVNWAGDVLRNGSDAFLDRMEAHSIINDWRAAHKRPMTHINILLRSHAKAVNPNFIIAQRLKRTPSIRHKLQRFHSMQLARMQDIGGCRVVLKTVKQVYELSNRIKRSRAKHVLAHSKDYISEPKDSGYRGLHLVFKYHSDTYDAHCGLMVEIQLRTTAQHIWATGVETVGTFIRSPLKSSIGPEDWLEFFARLSAVLHAKEMQPDNYRTSEVFLSNCRDLGDVERRIGAIRRLTGFGNVVRYVEQKKLPNTQTFVLHLKPVEGKISIMSFRADQSDIAMDTYSQLEQRADTERGEDVVLVKMDSIQELRKAYPNYFLDTGRLVKELESLEPFMS